jgi:hypothetical protein
MTGEMWYIMKKRCTPARGIGPHRMTEWNLGIGGLPVEAKGETKKTDFYGNTLKGSGNWTQRLNQDFRLGRGGTVPELPGRCAS